MSDELINRLGMAQIGACSCMTKSPDLEWHDESCKYRLFCEAADLIEQQAARIAALESAEKEAVPIYQTSNENGHVWDDVTPLDYEISRKPNKRIVYPAPASKEAIRREAFEDAASAALNASVDAIWADGRLMDPREIGSMCADAIRALAGKKGEQDAQS